MQKVNYLRAKVDESLYWKELIKAISSKTTKALGFLNHTENFLPESSLRSIYLIIVDTHFSYCCSVWGCSGTSMLLQLQKLKHRAARRMTNSTSDAPSDPLTKNLVWMKIADLISFESKQ